MSVEIVEALHWNLMEDRPVEVAPKPDTEKITRTVKLVRAPLPTLARIIGSQRVLLDNLMIGTRRIERVGANRASHARMIHLAGKGSLPTITPYYRVMM